MRNLEKKILSRVYRFEAKKTFTEFVIRTTAIIVAVFVAVTFGFSVITQLRQQQTLDLLQLFQEDVDTIRTYIGEVVSTFYQEIPKQDFLIFIFAFSGIFVFGLIFIKNFEKMKKKMLHILRYWLKIRS